MTARCPRGPRYPSRTQAKRARLDTRDPGAVEVVGCGDCGGLHLEPVHLTNHTSRILETRT